MFNFGKNDSQRPLAHGNQIVNGFSYVHQNEMNNSHGFLQYDTMQQYTALPSSSTQVYGYQEFYNASNSFDPPTIQPHVYAAVHPQNSISNTVIKYHNETPSTQWKGDFEMRIITESSIFSKKIFVGGVSRHMNEGDIIAIFKQYDESAVIEWPETRPNQKTPKGYLHIILSSSDSVKKLLKYCDLVIEGGCETYNLPIMFRNKNKQLQVIPWLISDSYFTYKTTRPIHKSMRYTVFIGALHGRMHAKAIAYMFNSIFGDVLDVTIDTDHHSYPTGSGRITFREKKSYQNAIYANFVQIESKKVSKRIQIEPCIDGQKCCTCFEEDVPNFCREPECFDYYCNHCWLLKHNPSHGVPLEHLPIRRKSKNLT